ncbi:efflux transporter outer membrane subunit [Piscinibacter sakaiensis]|uniref:RND efflux system, outer membrane lipoprotein CmeC n=1 Tax=Piscinibacter sakaiensis TaxID=1547922 RepID=A0A0K8P000_PISS1|nr:efflux transporter outer membrane subunit [Piscinibacter sakaiensis]GAP35505.1 RND efflux system, outer membrane lipoprotein CmeC [Piscinibacter sakaiensis]
MRRPLSTRRAPRRLAALAAAALLAGCGTMIPLLEKPPLPVAERYPGQPAGGSVAPAAADVPWQDFFADARLKRLIALALESNRDLRVAALAIEQARAQLQLRRADELPTVGAGVNASRAPGSNGSIVSTYSAGVQISAWEIDFFGRIRSLSEAARAQLLATEEARKAVQIGLVAGVAQAHLALQADEAQLEITRQTLETRQESLRLTRLRFDNGAASELDLRQAESLLEGARVTLAQTTRQRALDENALVLLLGRPLPADLPPAVPLGTALALADLPAGLPSDLLTRRPDLRQAEQQMVAANANIGAARAAFFPRISLTASAGIASNQLSGLFDNGQFAWTLAPSLLAPIFDAGRNRANLEAATLARSVATAQYEKAIQTAFREVADALAGRATLGEQLRAQAAQATALEATYRLADLRYRNGVASYLDVLDAQRSLFAAQLAVAQTQAAQLQNQVLLYKVLGGGWTEPAGSSTAAAPR